MVIQKSDFIASRKWTHLDRVTGKYLFWYQEDESTVNNKEDAIAMVQRTIDFWLPKMRDDLVEKRGLDLEKATRKAVESFKQILPNTLSSPFPKQFGLKMEDFKLHLNTQQ